MARGVGVWSKIQELEHATRLRSWRGQQDQGVGLWSEVVQHGHGARVAATKLGKCVDCCTKKGGPNKLSFGVFCSVVLSQEHQPTADAM